MDTFNFILFDKIPQIIDNDFGIRLIIICISTLLAFVLERFRTVEIIIIVTKNKKRKWSYDLQQWVRQYFRVKTNGSIYLLIGQDIHFIRISKALK